MVVESVTITMDTEKHLASSPPTEKDQEAGVIAEYTDKSAERAYGVQP